MTRILALFGVMALVLLLMRPLLARLGITNLPGDVTIGGLRISLIGSLIASVLVSLLAWALIR